MLDKFKDECGVFGIFGNPEAANLTYLGLYALQHRGQESAGIVTADGERMRVSRAMGHVADAFDESALAGAAGASGDRPHALFDGGREPDQQRAAVPDRLRPRTDRRRPQRQSRQRARAARRAGAGRRDLPDQQRYRSPAAPVRAVQGAVGRGSADRVDYADPRRVFARAADEGSPDRGARSARLPSARARPARRRVDRVLRDVRARSDWRDLRARHRAGRNAGHQRLADCDRSRRFRPRRCRNACSSTCTSRGRTATCSAAA